MGQTNSSGLKAGDEVVIAIKDLHTITQMQKAHGGWNQSMNECLIGPCKLVQGIGTDAIVKGPSGKIYRLNSELLSRYSTGSSEELKIGSFVELIKDEDEFKRLQVAHGEWSSNMKDILGKRVEVIHKFSDGDFKIRFNNSTFVINPNAIASKDVTVSVADKLKVGDKVVLIQDVDAMKKLQMDHGGWSDLLSLYVGKEVEIVEIFQDGDMYVSKFGMEWMINPRCIVSKDAKLSDGDIVLISKDIQKSKQLQHNHGGWVESMGVLAGKCGKIESVLPSGDVKVNVNGIKLIYNPLLLTRSDKSDAKIFSPGDNVRLINDKGKVKLLQKDHGEWVSSMKLFLGKKGKIKSLLPNGDLKVKIKHQNLRLNPECVEATDSDSDSDPGLFSLFEQLTQLINTDSDQSEHSDEHSDPDDAKVSVNEEIIKLFIAVKSGDLDEVRNLVDSVGANTCLKSLSPLMIAASEGHLDVTRLLLERNANLDIADRDGDTVLHLAVLKNQIKISDLLIRKGANVNAQNKKQFTPIMLAAAAGSHDILRLLVASSNADLSIADSDRDTALHLAVKKSRAEAVEILLDAGADIKALNKKLFNGFHLAAIQGHAKILEIFLKREGVKIVDSQKEDKFAAIHLVALNNHEECLKVLLKYNADINIRNITLQTALHIAVSQKYLNCVKILVENKAAVNLKDSDGDTPLHVAMKIKQMEVIKKMSEILGMGGLMGLLRMSEGSDTPDDIAIYLLKHGAVLDIKNTSGKTPTDMCNDDLLMARILSLNLSNPSDKDLIDTELPQLPEAASIEFHAPLPLAGAAPVRNLPKTKDEELEELRQKIRDMEDEKTCIICFDRPINVTFGCGHVACDVCANNLYDCHICRESIENKIRIYK